MTEHHVPSRRSVLAALGIAPLAAGGVLATSGAATADVPDGLRPGGELDRLLAQLAAEDAFSGTVLVTYRDKPVLARSHGMADKARRVPNGPDTIFTLGSITKMCTGVAIGQLAEQGRLGYGDKVGAHLDGFAPEIADTVTIHQLLTHTSGLGDFHSREYLEQSKHWNSVDEYWDNTMTFVRACELQATPGTDWIYSNAGFFVLGAIVAAASSGKPPSGPYYYDYVREHVFERAGMTSSDFYTKPQWRDDRRLAHPYRRDESGEWVDGVELSTFTGSPAGGSFASAPDLVRFAKAVQGKRLLTAAHTHILTSPKLPRSPDNTNFDGYSFGVHLVNGQWILGHNGGSTIGVACQVDWFPDTGWTAVVLGNYGDHSSKPVVEKLRELITSATA